jgi:DNA-nicking Smr family endonuclease
MADPDEILRYLDEHGVVDKDRDAGAKRAQKAASKGRHRVPRQTLDLHGLNSQTAALRVRGAIERCRDHGIAELLIIHGHGLHSNPNEGPVLKDTVLNLLDRELRSQIRSYSPALPKDGGAGATLVKIR